MRHFVKLGYQVYTFKTRYFLWGCDTPTHLIGASKYRSRIDQKSCFFALAAFLRRDYIVRTHKKVASNVNLHFFFPKLKKLLKSVEGARRTRLPKSIVEEGGSPLCSPNASWNLSSPSRNASYIWAASRSSVLLWCNGFGGPPPCEHGTCDTRISELRDPILNSVGILKRESSQKLF